MPTVALSAGFVRQAACTPGRKKVDLYEEPNVKDPNGEPVVNRMLTIMLAEEY
jgi:hypothetical protein